MITLQASTHKFERHKDNPRRVYFKDLSHGLDMDDKYKHTKVYWFGLWFRELRIAISHKPN